jgi:nicotinate-nucleotide pyrophosphorylase
VIAARQPGVLAGLDAALLAFELLDPALRIERRRIDGDRISRGEPVAHISGRARGVLGAERTALNLLSRMSGVATATRALADAVAGYKAKIVCTRKTTPGLRVLEKEAVRFGGGANHRFGLDDAMLIKDNHIALAGGVRIRFTIRVRSPTRQSRSRFGRLASSSAIVGTRAMLQWPRSPRSHPKNPRLSNSVSSRSVFARRCSRDTATLEAWIT